MEKKQKLCFIYTDSFIVYIKTENICVDIEKDVKARFGTLCYELERPLPREKGEKAIGLMKDELGGKIMTEPAALRPKTYSYVTGDNDENKKVKGTKKCAIKRKLKFEYYKNCLEANQLEKDKEKKLLENHKEFIRNHRLLLKS